jgi:hypothetical protein
MYSVHDPPIISTTHRGTHVCPRFFSFVLFGITGLLSASVFGLVIVRDGGLLSYRIT